MEQKLAEGSLETADFRKIWAEFAEFWVVSPTNSNLYHYAGNNPVKYTDPTGMWTIEFGIGVGVAGKIKFGHNEDKWEFSWRIGFGLGGNISLDISDTSFTEDKQSQAGFYIEGDISGDIGQYSVGVEAQIGIESNVYSDGQQKTEFQNDATISISYGDDPNDHNMVKKGIQLYEKRNK